MEFKNMHPADQLVEMMNRIYKYGMTTTSGGNLSIRDENGDIWITPSGVDKGSLTREDIMQVKPDGSYIGRHRPSVEFPFHRDIYKVRRDISGIVHAHPPVQVAFSLVRREPNARILPEVYHTCGDVTQVPYHAPGTAQLDEDISARFKAGSDTVLMANHGVVCGAEDLMQAFIAFETITLGGEAEINALRLGGANVLNEEQLACVVEKEALGEMKKEMPASGEEQQAREKMCALARRCYDRRLLSTAHGSISMRFGKGMLITPAGRDPLALKPEDIVRMKKGMLCGEEALLHLEIYEKQAHVNAAIITHAPSIMGFAAAGREFDSRMISEGYIILGDVQRAPFDAKNDEIASMFAPRRGVVVQDNRRAVVTGTSLINAFDRTEVLEYGAASVLTALSIGAPVTLSDGEIEHTKEALGLK